MAGMWVAAVDLPEWTGGRCVSGQMLVCLRSILAPVDELDHDVGPLTPRPAGWFGHGLAVFAAHAAYPGVEKVKGLAAKHVPRSVAVYGDDETGTARVAPTAGIVHLGDHGAARQELCETLTRTAAGRRVSVHGDVGRRATGDGSRRP